MQSPDLFLLFQSKDLLWAKWIEFFFRSNGYFVEVHDFSRGHIKNIPDWIVANASEQTAAVVIEAEEMYSSGTLAGEWEEKVQNSLVLRQTVMLRRKSLAAPVLPATHNKDLIGADQAEFENQLLLILGRLNFQFFNRKLASEQCTMEAPLFPGRLPRNWLMPYAPLSYFVGRNDELDKLADILGETHALSLYSNLEGRGHGLSSILVRAIYNNIKGFSTVWWINAEDPSLMLSELGELGHCFGIGSSANSLTEMWPVVCEGMQKHITRPFVVILDRPSPSVMQEFEHLAQQKWTNGTLVTIGVKPTSNEVESIEVGELPRMDAIWLFGLGATDVEESKDKVGPIENLASCMKYNPLLLRMAAHLVKSGQGVERFIEDYNLEGRMFTAPTPTLKPTMIITRFILDQLSYQHPDVAQLLIFSAYFSAHPIPHWLFEPSNVKHSLSHLFDDKEQFREAVKLLSDYGVVHRSNESYFVHTTIAKGILSMNDYLQNWQNTIVQIMSEKLSPSLPSSLLEERRRDIYPHALPLCLDLVKKNQINDQVTTLLNNVANQARSYRNPGLASELLQKLMAYFINTMGENSAEVSSLATNLGVIYNMEGKSSEALAMFERALATDKVLYGETHENIGDDLLRIARLFEVLKDYQRAAAEYEKALKIYIERLGEGHIKVARLLASFIATLKAMSKKDLVYTYAQKVVNIETQHYGEQSPRLCGSLAVLGLTAAEMGHNEMALSALEKALAIEKVLYGFDHPKVAVRLSHLANIHERIGNNARATENYRKAIAIFTDSLGSNHPSSKHLNERLLRLERV